MKKLVLFLFSMYEKMVMVLVKPIFHREQKYPLKRMNERPVEFAFAFKYIAQFYPKTMLDVGTGGAAFPHVVNYCGIKMIATDYIDNYWTNGMSNRHVPIVKQDITHPTLNQKFDMITCISVLEHIKENRAALKGMFSLLNEGGHIVLTFPYNENKYVEDVYRHPNAGYGKDHAFIGQVYSREQVNHWLNDNNAEIVAQEYYEVFTGELWTMGESIYPLKPTTADKKHHLTCILLKKKTA
jgi:SAM-dependent methyltransferase